MRVVSNIVVEKKHRIGTNQGRNSMVFLAYDPQLDGEVVLKEIPIHQLSNPGQYFSEAQTYYANKHPQVAPIMYACRDAQFIRIVMPYFKNGSLQDLLDRRVLTTREIIKYSQEFLNALHNIHSNKYVHFDIKPTNILIADNFSAMITDFGQSSPTNHLGVAQQPRLYAFNHAPENLGGGVSTNVTDIYQVGLTLYRMCNGQKWWEGQVSKYLPLDQTNVSQLIDDIGKGKFPNRQEFLPHVPKRLKTIIRKCLNIEAKNRYQTVLELKNVVGQIGELLDWQYRETSNGEEWTKESKEYYYKIEVICNQANKWNIIGKTIKKTNGVERKREAWCGGPYNTRKKAHSDLNKIFNGME